jgi:hypothetical protein
MSAKARSKSHSDNTSASCRIDVSMRNDARYLDGNRDILFLKTPLLWRVMD